MGIMVSEVYEALIDAGASEAKAKAAAEAIPVSEQLTTKTDLAGVKADLAEAKAELKAEIGEVKAELKAEIGEVKAELNAEIGEVRTQIAALEAKVWRAGVAIAALAVLLNKFLDWVIR